MFSKTAEIIFFKFSRMIDKGLKFVPLESQVSSLKSAEARYGSKIEFKTRPIFWMFFSDNSLLINILW